MIRVSNIFDLCFVFVGSGFCLSRFYVFWYPNCVSRVLPDRSVWRVGYIDAEWKVSASKISFGIGKFQIWIKGSLGHQIMDFQAIGFSWSSWESDWSWAAVCGPQILDLASLIADCGHQPEFWSAGMRRAALRTFWLFAGVLRGTGIMLLWNS